MLITESTAAVIADTAKTNSSVFLLLSVGFFVLIQFQTNLWYNGNKLLERSPFHEIAAHFGLAYRAQSF